MQVKAHLFFFRNSLVKVVVWYGVVFHRGLVSLMREMADFKPSICAELKSSQTEHSQRYSPVSETGSLFEVGQPQHFFLVFMVVS